MRLRPTPSTKLDAEFAPGGEAQFQEVLRQLRRLTNSTLAIVMQSGTLPDELAVRYARLGVRFFTDKHEPERIVEMVRDSLSRCSLLAARY